MDERATDWQPVVALSRSAKHSKWRILCTQTRSHDWQLFIGDKLGNKQSTKEALTKILPTTLEPDCRFDCLMQVRQERA